MSSEEFNRFISGDWNLPFEKPIRPYIMWKLLETIRQKQYMNGFETTVTTYNVSEHLSAALPLINDIRHSLTRMNIPAIVVYIPPKDNMIQRNNRDMTSRIKEVQLFTSLINAPFIDGSTAFTSELQDELRTMWFPHDAHWNQKGSDHFAEFMVEVLEDWP